MRNLICFFTVALLLTPCTTWADVRMPALFSDNMVLQQSATIPVWGWADDGESITVEIADQLATATAADGKWRAFLAPLAAGGPHELKITGKNTVTIQNVLVGENWVCGGQSNMAWSLERSSGAEAAIAAANLPTLRLFQVEIAGADTPQDELKGQWVECTPEAAAKFSAVGFYFGRGLQEHMKVPVGLIQACLGGTNASSWVPREVLANTPEFADFLKTYEEGLAGYPEAKKAYDAALIDYRARMDKAKADGVELTSEEKRPPAEPMGPEHVKRPSALYNGMIAPLQPFAVKGGLWYQGEANAKSVASAEQYRLLFPAVINAWRQGWGQERFPFLFVQLAAYGSNPAWPLARDAQTAALALDDTGMAVAIDVGQKDDIHPTDKATVAERLLYASRSVAYGEQIEPSGPVFLEMEKREGLIIAYFRNVSEGLRSVKPLTGFEIAGEDGVFHPAEAAIAGQTVVVKSPAVPEPLHVRYGWQAFPEPPCTLYNRAGLPAVPFRTDELPVVDAAPK